jgi:hypothetical protein
MALVKLLRFLAIVIYVGYLVNVGLLFVLLPWSRAWGMFMAIFPPGLTQILDAPWARGALSAFGVLHLCLVVWEMFMPTSLLDHGGSSRESQKLHSS